MVANQEPLQFRGCDGNIQTLHPVRINPGIKKSQQIVFPDNERPVPVGKDRMLIKQVENIVGCEKSRAENFLSNLNSLLQNFKRRKAPRVSPGNNLLYKPRLLIG